MCGRSSYRNREISGSTDGTWPLRSESRRQRAVADDARARAVRPRNSSDEADEQSRATGGGVGGANGGGRGKRGPAKQAPDAAPGKRVTGAGTRTDSRKAEEEGEVHRALPPYQRGVVTDGVLCPEAR